jgi:hypothetical protein
VALALHQRLVGCQSDGNMLPHAKSFALGPERLSIALQHRHLEVLCLRDNMLETEGAEAIAAAAEAGSCSSLTR